MKVPCLVVQKKNAQTAITVLKEQGILSPEHGIEEDEHGIWIPLCPGTFDEDLVEIVKLGSIQERDLVPVRKHPKSYKDLVDLPDDLRSLLPSSFDVIGEICIIKLPEALKGFTQTIGDALLRANRAIRTVAIDSGVKGDYRLRELTVIAGQGDLETVHIENNVRIKLDPSRVYFSPRLAAERSRIATLCGKERILDMFCGVGPFALTIARHTDTMEIIGIDINPECIRYFNENIYLNSVEDKVSAVLGDTRDVAPFLGKFDRIIMNLPHSSIDYLDCALECIESGMVHLYTIVDDAGIKEQISRIDMIATGKDKRCKVELIREVHQYSPDLHMMAFDLSIKGP
jgi:tRNA (guanine37-N1)-methyltransferase